MSYEILFVYFLSRHHEWHNLTFVCYFLSVKIRRLFFAVFEWCRATRHLLSCRRVAPFAQHLGVLEYLAKFIEANLTHIDLFYCIVLHEHNFRFSSPPSQTVQNELFFLHDKYPSP